MTRTGGDRLAGGEMLDRLCAGPADPRPAPRTTLIVAHPDDDVVGAGARLPRIKDSVHVVFVTDGAPWNGADAAAAGFADVDDYARARRAEALNALALAGISADAVTWLDVPDQAASFRLAEVTLMLRDLLDARRPELVLTHAYEGGHPDHDATAFAVHAACRRPVAAAPVIAEMSLYRATADGSICYDFLPAAGAGDEPRGDHSDAGLDRGGFDGAAPAAGRRTVVLSEAEQRAKRRLLECHVTQRKVLDPFPLDVERFRIAPAYDFTQPPHPGRLYYDFFPWGITGAEWRGEAARALELLGLRPAILSDVIP